MSEIHFLLDEDYLFPAESGRLHIQGEHFYTESGEIWQWRGFSWFLGFLRFCRGENITPDLIWLRENGFNIVRVFGPLPWDETPDYRYENFQIERLGEFFQLLADYGLRVEFCPLHYPAPTSFLQFFMQLIYDIAAEHWNVIVEVVNEPSVGKKPNPISAIEGVQRHGVLTAYGIYTPYTGNYEILDYSTIHTTRDAHWARKARHAQEVQHKSGKPCISDEPAKAIEYDFIYPGGRRDPKEFVWHHAICSLWTAGSTLHTEEGKWGRVPTPEMNQMRIVDAVREDVWKKIPTDWQLGAYNGSHSSSSPVDDVETPSGDPIWTYTSLHEHKALSVRCYPSEPLPRNGWQVISKWGAGNSLVILIR